MPPASEQDASWSLATTWKGNRASKNSVKRFDHLKKADEPLPHASCIKYRSEDLWGCPSSRSGNGGRPRPGHLSDIFRVRDTHREIIRLYEPAKKRLMRAETKQSTYENRRLGTPRKRKRLERNARQQKYQRTKIHLSKTIPVELHYLATDTTRKSIEEANGTP